MYVIYLIFGIFLLYYGANYLVKGSSTIAFSAGVKKIVVGLTLVALGTSMPEFMVSLSAAVKKVDDISIGNIVGSNLANVLLVLGVASIIRPIKARRRIFILDLPVLIGITILFVVFCSNGKLTSFEGGILLILFFAYMSFIIANRKVREERPVDVEKIESGHIIKNSIIAIGGLIALVTGGELVIIGAIKLARAIGISELFIGLTVVALGTSLPELFTSIVAIIKKEDEILIGNVIGSNLFNTAFVLGIIPIIYSLKIDEKIIRFDNLFLICVTILLSVFLLIGRRLSRIEGVFLLIMYAFFILNLGFNFI